MTPSRHQSSPPGLAASVASNAPGGFTLIELVMSLAILSIILLAVNSVVLLAARVADNGTSAASKALNASAAAGEIAADLNVAINFTEQTPNAVTFTVPDRNADGAPETLRYAWSGTSGDSLTRSINGSTASPVASDIRALTFSYLSRTATPQGASSINDTLLIGHYNSAASASALSDYAIDKQTFCAEYFLPTFPTGTNSWSVTRAFIMVHPDGPAIESLQIQIYTADSNGKPSALLDTATLVESTFPLTYGWVQATFTNATNLTPGNAYCLAVEQTGGGRGGDVQYESSGVADANDKWTTTSNGNGSSHWATPINTKAMRYVIYGTLQ